MSNPSEWTIAYYVDESGHSPVSDFLRSLDVKTRVRIDRAMEQLRTRNILAREPLARHLTGKIWELRVESQANIIGSCTFSIRAGESSFYMASKRKLKRRLRVKSRWRSNGWLNTTIRKTKRIRSMSRKRDIFAEGEAAYRQYHDELLSDPVVQEIYAEEAAKMDLWLQLAEARLASGLTQAEVAKRLGVSQAQVSRLEKRGYESYTLNSLRRYLEALGGGFVLEVKVRGIPEVLPGEAPKIVTARALKPEAYAPRRATGSIVAVKEIGLTERYGKSGKENPRKATKKRA
jgi:transcriptional regulator with XRE-family HTH domain